MNHRLTPSTRVVGALVIATALTSVVRAQDAEDAGVTTQIGDAVRELFSNLTPERANYGTAMFDDPKRFVWDYRPVTRSGLPLFALESGDRERLDAVLEAALGTEGAGKATEVMDLERLFYERTRDESRDPDWYFLAAFGVPAESGHWGLRFEGNHLSVNLTVRDGELIGTTPLFMGAQPTDSGADGLNVRGPLADTEAAARGLLESLSDQHQRRAIFSATPPDDIITGSSDRASRPVMLGIRYAELEPEQQTLLRDLVAAHAARWEPRIASAELDALEAAGFDEVRFGWAGSVEPTAPSYYRVQGRDFIIEQGHVDGDTDHVHSVWRKFDDDFGRRAIQEAARQATTTTITPLGGVTRQPATSEETAAAAAAAVRKLELVGDVVAPNGCVALVEITNRRPLLPSDTLPRTVQRDVDLEVLTLTLAQVNDQEDVENRCETGAEIDAVSPQHPSKLIGRSAWMHLTLIGDSRGSVWQASRIRLQR
ncbi:MAG: DUF3500 domain-containing protein [Acidobacteria bacterium]|nr:DUF3500 domain-containing protein [Acidobacteriota bacterium]